MHESLPLKPCPNSSPLVTSVLRLKGLQLIGGEHPTSPNITLSFNVTQSIFYLKILTYFLITLVVSSFLRFIGMTGTLLYLLQVMLSVWTQPFTGIILETMVYRSLATDMCSLKCSSPVEIPSNIQEGCTAALCLHFLHLFPTITVFTLSHHFLRPPTVEHFPLWIW